MVSSLQGGGSTIYTVVSSLQGGGGFHYIHSGVLSSRVEIVVSYYIKQCPHFRELISLYVDTIHCLITKAQW